MTSEQHHSAGIVLYRPGEERTFLLLRSAMTRRPLWEFPKGGVEAGESELQAAERELQEETGIHQGGYRVLEGFHEVEHYTFMRGAGEGRRVIRKRVAYFLAEWRAGEVHLSPEATRYVWASEADALRLLRFPEKRRVLASAVRWLGDEGTDSGAMEMLQHA
ncbi:MAG TPA: NUDIX domain-containing protein [Longimicrobiaceae bacterium]|nr:NUDIX domain-containing protein [Longimicrobiaceae bacterium]